MNKCSVHKNPHFIYRCLILSKVLCSGVNVSMWGCFKGVSSLSGLRLAGNVDYLLDEVTGLVGFCLVPESDESSDNVSNDSSEENEDEESDEISI